MLFATTTENHPSVFWLRVYIIIEPGIDRYPLYPLIPNLFGRVDRSRTRLRLLSGYIFFLLLSLPAVAQNASWWYPLGPPEATRRISAPTGSQSVDDLQVKWRTPLLKNSPVLLVGSIYRDSAQPGAQQVVGMENGSNRLTVLSSGGRRLVDKPANEQQIGPGNSLRLTGLFNSTASTPDPTGSPDLIGFGVERTQETIASPLFGLLADSAGNIVRFLGIDTFESDLGTNNARAGVFPVAVFTPLSSQVPIAIAIVSQDDYDATAEDTMINSLRRYRLEGRNIYATQQWSTPFAPRGYEQHPGILEQQNAVLVAPSNSTYAPPVDRTVRPPSTSGSQVETSSDIIYSLNYRVDDIAPEVIDAKRIPPTSILPGTVFGRGDSYFMLQYASQSDPNGTWRRISTENHSPEDTGLPRIYVNSATQRISSPEFEAIYEPPVALRPSVVNHGWSIAVADLDGSDNTSPATDLIPNKGDELVSALSLPGNPDIASNRLFIFRWNDPPLPAGGTSRLIMFASAPFSGRLIGTGDLVSDPEGRQEILVANGDTLRILQLRPYNHALFGGAPAALRQPFEVLWTKTFDSRIVSVALADLEGDNANDIIVSTEQMTYAVGHPPALPFGAVSVTDTVCLGNVATVRWSRRAGDGSDGTRVLVYGADDTLRLANPAGTPDSLVIETGSLQPGRYRVVVQDPSLPALVDSSGSFVVLNRSIARFNLPDTAVSVGDSISIRSTVSCVGGVELQLSYDRGTWARAEFNVIHAGNRIDLGSRIPCPPQIACGATGELVIYYRLASPEDEIISAVDSLRLVIAPRPVTITPGGDTSRARKREISWNAEDFGCSQVRISLEVEGQPRWDRIVPASLETYTLDVPAEFAGEVTVRICCADLAAPSCVFGTAKLQVERLEETNFIAPNPFDPARHTEGARILYNLTSPGVVDVVIYDASRAIVRRLAGSEEQEPGFHGELFWDGRNERGEIVANGTYICVIESSSGERILLQMIVVKH